MIDQRTFSLRYPSVSLQYHPWLLEYPWMSWVILLQYAFLYYFLHLVVTKKDYWLFFVFVFFNVEPLCFSVIPLLPLHPVHRTAFLRSSPHPHHFPGLSIKMQLPGPQAPESKFLPAEEPSCLHFNNLSRCTSETRCRTTFGVMCY